VEEAGSPGALKLSAASGALYRKHFLDLGGLGVRDLCVDPGTGDLLVLAGVTMAAGGPAAIFRWRDIPAADSAADSLTQASDKRLVQVLELPSGGKCDRPEGMAVLPGSNGRSVVIVYDSPCGERYDGETGVRADVFSLST
jgi:hypothetical protein